MSRLFSGDSGGWRRVMLQSQLDLVSLFVATGRAALKELRYQDYEFAKARALSILQEVKGEFALLTGAECVELERQLAHAQAEVLFLTWLREGGSVGEQ